jgi:hypothetical protein
MSLDALTAGSASGMPRSSAASGLVLTAEGSVQIAALTSDMAQSVGSPAAGETDESLARLEGGGASDSPAIRFESAAGAVYEFVKLARE